jgi:hypothetical protein
MFEKEKPKRGSKRGKQQSTVQYVFVAEELDAAKRHSARLYMARAS